MDSAAAQRLRHGAVLLCGLGLACAPRPAATPVIDLAAGDLSALRADFNRSERQVRLVLLLSPS